MVHAGSTGSNAVGGKSLTAWTLSGCIIMQPYCNKRLGRLQRYASTSEEGRALTIIAIWSHGSRLCARSLPVETEHSCDEIMQPISRSPNFASHTGTRLEVWELHQVAIADCSLKIKILPALCGLADACFARCHCHSTVILAGCAHSPDEARASQLSKSFMGDNFQTLLMSNEERASYSGLEISHLHSFI